MTITELDQIAARADAATPGPWRLAGNDARQNIGIEMASEIVSEYSKDRALVTLRATVWKPERWGNAMPNAAFIAAARQDVPMLVNLARELMAERDGAITRATHEMLNHETTKAENDRLRARLRTIHDECAPYADGSETAPIHDKLCARIAHLAKL